MTGPGSIAYALAIAVLWALVFVVTISGIAALAVAMAT